MFFMVHQRCVKMISHKLGILIILYLFTHGKCAKMNTPRILLPWLEDINVNFTFEVHHQLDESGCYSWSLSRDDIISIEPQYEEAFGHCSRSAHVSVARGCAPPGSVIILAEEVHTGEILRGDVSIDKISSLKVTSTTWNLYLEEAPEAFEVVAYDDDGNTFSTLEGIKFNWTIQNTGSNSDEEPLVKLIRWSDTDYEAPNGVAELEEQGLHSYSVLLYGQTIGEAVVLVCLGHICTDFSLNVIASVVLTPATATIAPGDTLRYKVVRAKAGRLTVQNIADTMYFIRTTDDKIAYLDDSISLIRGHDLGSTTVNLYSGITEVAAASLTVARPHSIRVSIRPSSLLVQDEQFLIHCVVLDADGHILTAGDETLIRLTVNGEANVHLLHSTENGTLTDAVARDIGTFIVTAKLHSVAGKSVDKVEGQASAAVVEPLRVIPPQLYIAWTDTIQELKLNHAGGGDEEVVWSHVEAADVKELSISPKGNLLVRGIGEITVKVQLQKHPHVTAYGRVLCAAPEVIRASSTGQARVSKLHHLHVAVSATHPDTGEVFNFHKCNCGTFSVALLEGPEPHNVTSATWIEPEDGACCVLQTVWSERGVCTLRVSRGRAGDAVRVVVRAAPLLLWPPHAAALLFATLPVLAQGEALFPHSADPRIAEVTLRDGPAPHRFPELQLFTVTCRRKGVTTISLRSQADEIESVDFEAACAPSVQRLKLEPPASAGNCSGGPRLWLRPGREVKIKVTLFDAAGRELLDESGPKVTWEMSPRSPALEYVSPEKLLIELHPEFVPVPVPHGYYQVVIADEQAVGWSGTLKATIPDASATIQAKVVGPLHVDRAKVNVAFEGERIDRIAAVSGGSGRYSVEAPKGITASVEGGVLSAVVPGPGSYDFLVSDMCLADENRYIEVNVEEVLHVEVVTPRAVGVGGCVPASALVKGRSHRYLATSSAPEWRVSSAVEMREGRLCGLSQGTAKLRASYAGVWSPEVEVLVFPPLSVSPPKARLPVGARLQLRHEGGPPPHLAAMHYEAVDGVHHIEVSPSGLLTGVSLGGARVRLTARDLAEVEMAGAEAEVEIVPISGIAAKAATSTLLVGSPAPLWLEATGELGPSVLAGLQPPPRVTWSVRDPVTARLYATHRDDLLERSFAEGLSVRVVPLKPGPVIIDVSVRNMGQLDSRSWDTTVDIIAISDLQTSVEGLAQHLRAGDRLAVAAGSTLRLKSAPRATWRMYCDDGAFEVTSNGELTALKPGHGVVIAQHKDERNGVFRETVTHVEVSAPQYCTAEPAGQEHEDAVRLVVRNNVGRALLCPDATLMAHPTPVTLRRSAHSALGNELVITGLEPAGAFMTVQGAVGALTLQDEVWVTPTAPHTDRRLASGGWAVCVPGSGWRGPPSVALHEGDGVTLAVLEQDAPARHTLRADRPARTLAIHQLPVTKIEFVAGEWPPALVPLAIESSGLKGGPVLCSEEELRALVGLDVPLPFACRTEAPHTARPALDLEIGQMGCSVSTASPIKEPSELEVCAEWAGGRVCTRVQLLPSIQVDPPRVSLASTPPAFKIKGHPRALKAVKVLATPGIRVDTQKRDAEWTVLVRGESSCAGGLVGVSSVLTGQQFNVEVDGDCDKACGSLLGALMSLLLPYLPSVATVAVAVGAALYMHSIFGHKTSLRAPSQMPQSVIRPPSPTSSAWPRSPGLPRSPHTPPPGRPSFSPRAADTTTPVYGDASLLPDHNFTPTPSRIHSRYI